MKEKPVVYLAGPIANDSDANSWRLKIIETLGDRFEFLNPMVRRYGEEPYVGCCGIRRLIDEDLMDIRRSDFIFCHIPNNVVAVGTNMEIFYAATHQIPIYAFQDSRKQGNTSIWLRRYCTQILPDLEEFIEYISEMFALGVSSNSFCENFQCECNTPHAIPFLEL
jgi:nucleoside 2-deoxyribosyltransferase